MKKLLFILTGISAMLLGSCVRELWNEETAADATLRLSVNVESIGAGSHLTTRTTVNPEPGEDNIFSLYLLFFEPDANRNGNFIDYVKIEQLMGAGIDTEIDLEKHSALTVTDSYNILAVANIGDNRYLGEPAASWMSQWIGKSENEVMNQAIAQVEGSTAGNDNAVHSDKLLMYGRVVKAKDQFHLNLVLTRNMARIDVVNNENEQYDLMTVEIRNAYSTASIWHDRELDFSASVAASSPM
jgi:hypothetical protein